MGPPDEGRACRREIPGYRLERRLVQRLAVLSRGYPPLFYLAAAALNGLGVGAMSAMNVLMAVSYLAMTVSLFGLVRVATGSRLGGMVAAGLAMATPAFWTPYVQGGLYTRVFGMG